ncbi:MAG TPA: hypothetical protein VH278_07140 [Burkholderiaceae bacterium]|nr:hypothetical protein [Burkholderiaceae bacterium]
MRRFRVPGSPDAEAIAHKTVSVPLDGARDLFYADSNSPGTLHSGAEALGLLKRLRNQAVLATRPHFQVWLERFSAAIIPDSR